MNGERYRNTQASDVLGAADDFVMAMADNDCLNYFNVHGSRPIGENMPHELAPTDTRAILDALQNKYGIDYDELYDHAWINTESEFV